MWRGARYPAAGVGLHGLSYIRSKVVSMFSGRDECFVSWDMVQSALLLLMLPHMIRE